MNYIYSNSYLECYKKHYSFELNKNAVLKTFDLNVRVLFRETYIRFDYKQWETYSETFFRSLFLKTLKQKVTLDSWCIYQSLSQIIKMKRLYFCFNFWKKQIKYSCPWKQNVWKRLFEATWAHLISNFFSATQPWWVALLDIHFRFFVPLS